MSIELTGLITSARALMSIASGAIEARDDAKAKQAITDANGKMYELSIALLSSAEKLSALQAANHELEGKTRALEAQIAENARYKLTPLSNGYAYLLLVDSGVQTPSQPIYFCQHCRDKGVKSILRELSAGEWHSAQWQCIEEDQHTIYK